MLLTRPKSELARSCSGAASAVRRWYVVCIALALLAANFLLSCATQPSATQQRPPGDINGHALHTLLAAFDSTSTLEFHGQRSVRVAHAGASGGYAEWTVAVYSIPGEQSRYPNVRIESAHYFFCRFAASAPLRLCGGVVSYISEELEWILDRALELENPAAPKPLLVSTTNHQVMVDKLIDDHGRARGKQHGQVTVSRIDGELPPIPALEPVQLDWCMPTLAQVLRLEFDPKCPAMLRVVFDPLLSEGRVAYGTPALLAQLMLQHLTEPEAQDSPNFLYLLYLEDHNGRKDVKGTAEHTVTRSQPAPLSSGDLNFNIHPVWAVGMSSLEFSDQARLAKRALARSRESIVIGYWLSYLRGLSRQYFIARYDSSAQDARWTNAAKFPNPIVSELGRGYLDGLRARPDPPRVRRRCAKRDGTRCYSRTFLQEIGG